MPKPIFGINGSGMHTNMSLFQGGKNAFYDPDDPKGLSKEAYSFIAGLLAHVKGMAAVTNPLVNSYKRLVPGYEAPCYLAWSASNRSALIRIPAARGQSTRVELRSPDPACNPYLELAVCLAAGLDGIEKGMTPPAEITENIYAMDAAARKVIEDAGYGPYFGHSFGHSVGVEIHESPNATPANNKPLPLGAAVSAEPGIYLPGRFGVRIEDVVVLQEGGCQDITLAKKDLLIL